MTASPFQNRAATTSTSIRPEATAAGKPVIVERHHLRKDGSVITAAAFIEQLIEPGKEIQSKDREPEEPGLTNTPFTAPLPRMKAQES